MQQTRKAYAGSEARPFSREVIGGEIFLARPSSFEGGGRRTEILATVRQSGVGGTKRASIRRKSIVSQNFIAGSKSR